MPVPVVRLFLGEETVSWTRKDVTPSRKSQHNRGKIVDEKDFLSRAQTFLENIDWRLKTLALPPRGPQPDVDQILRDLDALRPEADQLHGFAKKRWTQLGYAPPEPTDIGEPLFPKLPPVSVRTKSDSDHLELRSKEFHIYDSIRIALAGFTFPRVTRGTLTSERIAYFNRKYPLSEALARQLREGLHALRRLRNPAPEPRPKPVLATPTAEVMEAPDDAMLTHVAIAKRWGKTTKREKEAVRKILDRWRLANPDESGKGWVRNEDRPKHEPLYLYRWGTVKYRRDRS